MSITFIPFDGWNPGGGYFGEGWPIANNLYPGFGSVGRPWRKFTNVGTGVADGPMLLSYAHTWAAGIGTTSYTPDAQTVFTGSRSKLYTVDRATGAFTDVSRGAGYAAAGEPAGWRFASVGNDIWATNWLDPLQRRTNNAGLFANGLTGAFLPEPRFIAVIRQHLVWANDSTGRQDDWGWSDADNATDMNPPTGTSTSIAGRPAPLVSIPGQITGLLGGQYGLAFKRKGIYLLEYTGTSQVLRPEILSDEVGTAYPSSIIRTRHGVFFLGQDGFYQIVGMSAPVKISPQGVDQFLLNNTFSVEPSGITAWEEDTQAEGFSAAGEPRISWGYRDIAAGIGSTGVIHYNPITQGWGYGDLQPNGSGSFLSRQSGADLSDTVSAFYWDGTNSTYARYSTGVTAADYQEILLELRYRPANFESAGVYGQSVVKGVLPMFSKEAAFSGSSLQPSVSVDSALDPFQTGFSTENRPAAERDSISGWYPFEEAGRFFRIRMLIPAALIEEFHGVWIDQELLA